MIPSVEIWTCLGQGGNDSLVGIARFALRRSALSTTFQYEQSYLSMPNAYALQPDMPLRSTPYHFSGLPGALRDSAPDRWGRRIVLREQAEHAAALGVSPHSLDDADFLLGVSDVVRQGALRFKAPGESQYLSPTGAGPPLIQLPRLLAASKTVGAESAHERLKELLDAGSSSLGGARPKAAVTDMDKLYIAKFPQAADNWDVMAWEKTALDLAYRAKIAVPACRLIRLGQESCLLSERFDRVGTNRIPYLSAMSAMGLTDGSQSDYAELGEAMEELVGDVSRQLEALFRRVVFSIAVHNTDDHLRNHGFIRHASRWTLSPMFDVNPEPSLERERTTAVYGEVGDGEARSAHDLAAAFGLSEGKASSIVGEVLHSMSSWEKTARANGCPEAELRMFRPMFQNRFQALASAFAL